VAKALRVFEYTYPSAEADGNINLYNYSTLDPARYILPAPSAARPPPAGKTQAKTTRYHNVQPPALPKSIRTMRPHQKISTTCCQNLQISLISRPTAEVIAIVGSRAQVVAGRMWGKRP